MTQPRTPALTSAQPPPFGAMLRAALVPMLCTAPVIVVIFWLTRHAKGGLASLLGVCIAALFFASGLYVMKRITNASPFSVLVGAIAVYLGQMIFLGLVILSLSSADWLDGQAFGLSVLAVALIWQVVQVVAFARLRKPVYDEPGDELADEPGDEPGDEPADEPAELAKLPSVAMNGPSGHRPNGHPAQEPLS